MQVFEHTDQHFIVIQENDPEEYKNKGIRYKVFHFDSLTGCVVDQKPIIEGYFANAHTNASDLFENYKIDSDIIP